MRRRHFLKAAGLASAATAIAKPAVAQSSPQITWRLASSFPANLELIWSGAQTFAQFVREQSDGRFTIEPHPAGEIVGALDVFDAVADGRVDCAQTALNYFLGKEAALVFATGAPFGMNAREQNAFFHSGGNDLIGDVLAEHKLFALPCGNTGCQMGGWFRNELRSAADLRGLKIRISGFAAKILQTMGAEPKAVARGEIAASLESKALDAVAWVSPVDDERLGIVRQAPHYYYPGWFQSNMAIHTLFNAQKWSELPKSYQAIVRAAADAANLEMQAKYDAANPRALRRLAEAGVKLHAFPSDVMDAAWDAAEKVYKETSEQDEKFKRLHEAYMSFRNDQYLWWQVAEYPFDNFMIRQRAKG